MRLFAFGFAALLAGCAPGEMFGDRVSVTLYRNSPMDSSLRVHWATFDASDGTNYNLSNCQMAARLLNANLAASAEAEGKKPFPSVGFWCEVGSYKETGGAPIQFDAAFPTDTTGPLRFTK